MGKAFPPIRPILFLVACKKPIKHYFMGPVKRAGDIRASTEILCRVNPVA